MSYIRFDGFELKPSSYELVNLTIKHYSLCGALFQNFLSWFCLSSGTFTFEYRNQTFYLNRRDAVNWVKSEGCGDLKPTNRNIETIFSKFLASKIRETKANYAERLKRVEQDKKNNDPRQLANQVLEDIQEEDLPEDDEEDLDPHTSALGNSSPKADDSLSLGGQQRKSSGLISTAQTVSKATANVAASQSETKVEREQKNKFDLQALQNKVEGLPNAIKFCEFDGEGGVADTVAPMRKAILEVLDSSTKKDVYTIEKFQLSDTEMQQLIDSLHVSIRDPRKYAAKDWKTIDSFLQKYAGINTHDENEFIKSFYRGMLLNNSEKALPAFNCDRNDPEYQSKWKEYNSNILGPMRNYLAYCAQFRMVSSLNVLTHEEDGTPIKRQLNDSLRTFRIFTTNAPNLASLSHDTLARLDCLNAEKQTDGVKYSLKKDVYTSILESLFLHYFQQCEALNVRVPVLSKIGQGSFLHETLRKEGEECFYEALGNALAKVKEGTFDAVILSSPGSTFDDSAIQKQSNVPYFSTNKGLLGVVKAGMEMSYRMGVLNPGDPSCIPGQNFRDGHIAMEELIALQSSLTLTQSPKFNSKVMRKNAYEIVDTI